MAKIAYTYRFLLAVLLTSFMAGFSGILMHKLLDLVEWLVYGKVMDNTMTLVNSVSPFRLLIAVTTMSLFVAIIWYFLQKKHPIVSVKKQSTSTDEAQLLPRFWKHVLHTFMQIAFVGAGGSVGKEGAPREFGALSAGRISHRLNLNLRDKHLLIISGAAAGLAAVYQVPLSSFFFAFETFALAISLRSGLVVLFTTYVATAIANPIVTGRATYELARVSFTAGDLPAIVVLAVLVTPLASLFRYLAQKANKNRRKDKSILYCLPLAGFITGLIALVYPNILGNGSALAQSVFDGLGLSNAVILLVLKAFVVLLSLVAGAYGGTLTPSFAMGSLLGLITFDLTQHVLPISQPELLMLAGSASFLAVTMQAPLTAAGLAIAFTKQRADVLIPVLLAVTVTMTLHKLWFRLYQKS